VAQTPPEPVGEFKLTIGVQDSAGQWHPIGEVGMPIRIQGVSWPTGDGAAEVTVEPDGEGFAAAVETFLSEPTTLERISEAIERQYRTTPAG
jgi:hypothetical protein